jgi:hypothetical protein
MNIVARITERKAAEYSVVADRIEAEPGISLEALAEGLLWEKFAVRNLLEEMRVLGFVRARDSYGKEASVQKCRTHKGIQYSLTKCGRNFLAVVHLAIQ